MLFGAFVMIAGSSSCKKDDSNECCSMSWNEGENSYSAKACEDGTASYTTNGETETSSWKEGDSSYTWAELKESALESGASCN